MASASVPFAQAGEASHPVATNGATEAAPKGTRQATSERERLRLGPARPRDGSILAREDGVSQPRDGDASQASPASLARTGASLVIVLGLIVGVGLGLRMLAKRGGRAGTLLSSLGAGGRSPAGLLEVLGRYPLPGGLTLVVLKFDRRVLLVAQSGGRGLRGAGGSMQTLCELHEPEDVASVLLKTRSDEGTTLAAKFQEVLRGEDMKASAVLDAPAPVAVRAHPVEGGSRVEGASRGEARGQPRIDARPRTPSPRASIAARVRVPGGGAP
jgi:flagellar biogenesis protein FliO